MSETLAVNVDRNFKVQVTPCVVTKQFDRCIVVPLGEFEIALEDGEKKTCVVEAAFSRVGLQSLMADLESVSDPLGLPSQDDVKSMTNYQWAVVMTDGEHYQQFPIDSIEKPFREIHLPNVKEFWIIPKTDPYELPWYGLISGTGFVKRDVTRAGDETELLNLPYPDVAFEWHYYRRISHTFALGLGQSYQVPAHVVQCLGWRVPNPDGEDLVFEIGIESDGTWQVNKREPLENSPYWD